MDVFTVLPSSSIEIVNMINMATRLCMLSYVYVITYFTGILACLLDTLSLRCLMQCWMKSYASVFQSMIILVQMQFVLCFWQTE